MPNYCIFVRFSWKNTHQKNKKVKQGVSTLTWIHQHGLKVIKSISVMQCSWDGSCWSPSVSCANVAFLQHAHAPMQPNHTSAPAPRWPINHMEEDGQNQRSVFYSSDQSYISHLAHPAERETKTEGRNLSFDVAVSDTIKSAKTSDWKTARW